MIRILEQYSWCCRDVDILQMHAWNKFLVKSVRIPIWMVAETFTAQQRIKLFITLKWTWYFISKIHLEFVSGV